MSWRDDLLPASFRGVAFQYYDTRREGGRRIVNNEYPLREENSTEDMGRKARTHRIQGFVLGVDYFSDRDALEDALDGEGPATLVHPYKGNLTVVCESFAVHESIDEGRLARFEMSFVESGAQPSPTSASDTSDVAASAATGQQDTLASDFGSLYSLDGLPGFIRDALSGNIMGLVSDLTSLAGLPGLVPGSLDGAIFAIVSAIEDPISLGLAVMGFFSDYADGIAEIQPVDDPTLTSRGQPAVADPSYGLAGFATWGNDLAPVLGTTPQRQQQSVDQAALVAVAQGGAVSALAQLYASTNFVSAGDAEAARDQMNDLIDIQATVAADAGDDIAYAGWMALFTAVSADLTTRGQQLPQVLDFSFASNLPALVLAETIYQDGSRAAELVARNAAPHPLFMPRQVEALAA